MLLDPAPGNRHSAHFASYDGLADVLARVGNSSNRTAYDARARFPPFPTDAREITRFRRASSVMTPRHSESHWSHPDESKRLIEVDLCVHPGKDATSLA